MDLPDIQSSQSQSSPLSPSSQSQSQSSRLSSVSSYEFSPLDWVGIEKVMLPVQLFSHQPEQVAFFHAGVNLLEQTSRGIHMSRMYSLLEKQVVQGPFLETLDPLVFLHQSLISQQEGLSTWACLSLSVTYTYFCKSLKSGIQTQRAIPLKIEIQGCLDQPQVTLSLETIYSSTCPQSYALATQSMVESFQETFGGGEKEISFNGIQDWLSQGLVATPHAQRSSAQVSISWSLDQFRSWFEGYPQVSSALEALILLVETALGTVSQSLVKREDEKEFAKLNACNTMFCEDAARRLYTALNHIPSVSSFHGEVRHFESLHPFDVKATFSSKKSSV
jgi:GTP cyclohydrolase IB